MSHLTVIIDCSPTLNVTQNLYMKWLDSIVSFCNSHLMLDEKNDLTIIASYTTSNRVIVSTKDGLRPSQCSPEQYGQFEKFTFITNAIRKGIIKLVSNCESRLSDECLLASALATALCKINRAKCPLSRILVVSCSMQVGKYSSQYMNMMNAFFAAQKMNVIIDGCVFMNINNDSRTPITILEQGCDLTGGTFMNLPQLSRNLEYLLWIFLPDQNLRQNLLLPERKKATHRAACFCHRNIIDVGYVCSVCLSIFCTFSPICSTCQSHFKIDLPTKLLDKIGSTINQKST